MRYEFKKEEYIYDKIYDDIDDEILEKTRLFRENLITRCMAYYVVLWLKKYRINCWDYNLIAQTIVYDIDIDNIEKMLKEAKKILKDKYNITVIQENPFTITCDTPLDELDEDWEILLKD